jgi:hypothetical protein
MQVRQTLKQTATQFNDGTSRTAVYPNNFYGWGRVNALRAVLAHGIVFSSRPLVQSQAGSLRIVTSIVAPTNLVADSLFLYYQTAPNTAFRRVRLTPTGTANEFTATILAPVTSTYPRGYFSARSTTGELRRSPFNAPDSLFYLGPTPDSLRTYFPWRPKPSIPEQFILHPNYPNPFNSGTVIRFDAPAAEDVELGIYNVLGQRVKTLFVGTSLAGANRFTWDGSADGGIPAATGVYLLRLKTPTAVLSKRMVYLR